MQDGGYFIILNKSLCSIVNMLTNAARVGLNQSMLLCV